MDVPACQNLACDIVADQFGEIVEVGEGEERRGAARRRGTCLSSWRPFLLPSDCRITRAPP